MRRKRIIRGWWECLGCLKKPESVGLLVIAAVAGAVGLALLGQGLVFQFKGGEFWTAAGLYLAGIIACGAAKACFWRAWCEETVVVRKGK